MTKKNRSPTRTVALTNSPTSSLYQAFLSAWSRDVTAKFQNESDDGDVLSHFTPPNMLSKESLSDLAKATPSKDLSEKEHEELEFEQYFKHGNKKLVAESQGKPSDEDLSQFTAFNILSHEILARDLFKGKSSKGNLRDLTKDFASDLQANNDQQEEINDLEELDFQGLVDHDDEGKQPATDDMEVEGAGDAPFHSEDTTIEDIFAKLRCAKTNDALDKGLFNDGTLKPAHGVFTKLRPADTNDALDRDLFDNGTLKPATGILAKLHTPTSGAFKSVLTRQAKKFTAKPPAAQKKYRG